jgi:hypothetical protein
LIPPKQVVDPALLETPPLLHEKPCSKSILFSRASHQTGRSLVSPFRGWFAVPSRAVERGLSHRSV